MARGGGGGGRGGGGRGGRGRSSRHHGTSYSRPATPMDRGISIFIAAFIMLLASFLNMDDTGTKYDEEKLSTFASGQYELVFGDTAAYEDNLLLVFVVYEDRSDFSYMTWVGDHIGDETFQYLQGQGTWLDDLLEKQIQYDYTYSLSSDLARAIRDLANKIDAETEFGSHTCSETRTDSPTCLRNLSDVKLNEELLTNELQYFREETLIPIVLVVEDAADIFN